MSEFRRDYLLSLPLYGTLLSYKEGVSSLLEHFLPRTCAPRNFKLQTSCILRCHHAKLRCKKWVARRRKIPIFPPPPAPGLCSAWYEKAHHIFHPRVSTHHRHSLSELWILAWRWGGVKGDSTFCSEMAVFSWGLLLTVQNLLTFVVAHLCRLAQSQADLGLKVWGFMEIVLISSPTLRG